MRALTGAVPCGAPYEAQDAVERSVPSMRREVMGRLWVLIAAGIPTGVLVAGAGSRLAMFILRLTSPESVRGVRSDDGFVIGRFSLGGTYNLLALGAVVGLIGAAAYRAVSPWLIGPRWFRRCTVAAASGVVVGSILVHADGIDFRLLEPRWLAVGLFVALPALFGVAISCSVDRAAAAERSIGRRWWITAAALVLAFPIVITVVLLAALVLACWVPIRRRLWSGERSPVVVATGVRAAWLGVAMLGLVAFVNDIRALS